MSASASTPMAASRKSARVRSAKRPVTAAAAAASAISAGGRSGSKAMETLMDAPYCPSRSRIAGTCTWSAL